MWKLFKPKEKEVKTLPSLPDMFKRPPSPPKYKLLSELLMQSEHISNSGDREAEKDQLTTLINAIDRHIELLDLEIKAGVK